MTNGIGGQPSVRFDGVDDHFSLNAGFEDFTAGSTMYVVSRSSALQSGFKLVALGNGAGQQNMVLGRAGNSDGLQYFTTASTGNYGWFNTSAALTTNEINVIRVDQAGGAPNDVVTATVSVNGAEVGSGSVFVPPVTTRSTNYIGKSYWNEGRFQGDIAEILLYNRTLTPAEHAAIETHINNTYSGDPAPDPVPDTPTGLIATAGDATVELGWNPIDGADGYKLYRTTNGNTPTEIADVATPGHTDTGVTNDTAYTYTVTAYNTTGESTPTTGTSATPTAPEPEPDPVIPTDGLVLSLDATELAATLADGAPISTWTDTSPAGHHASASGSARPTLVTNGIGGQPSVRFDGVDDHFSLNAGFEDFTAGSTMYVVSRSSALQSGFKLVALGNGAGQQNMVLGRAGNSDGLQYFTTASTGNYGWFNTSAALTTNEINVIRVDQAGGAPNDVVTATVSVNGAEVGSGSVFVPPVTTRSTNYIGKSYWNEGRFQGDIAEILLYNRTPTPAEHAAIETHINNTYRLAS